MEETSTQSLAPSLSNKQQQKILPRLAFSFLLVFFLFSYLRTCGTSVLRETNLQDHTITRQFTVASVSLSVVLKAKHLFKEFQRHLLTFYLVPTDIG